MKTNKTESREESASDLVSSLMFIPAVQNPNPMGTGKRPGKKNDATQEIRTARRHSQRKNTPKSTSLPSYDSHTSFDSGSSPQSYALQLSSLEIERFRQCIEREYDALEKSEAGRCYYIESRSSSLKAHQELEKAIDGTFFVRPAHEGEQTLNAKYFLAFVCHKQVVEVPICCDKAQRAFWFLSGCGHGSEVKREYIGIDVLIQHKQENNFYELQYPFRICLYQPYRPNDSTITKCIPLPDEVRAIGGRNTILHELATRGLTKYLNELTRIAKNDTDPLREKCRVVANKINGRNKEGQTPLILAIQSSKYEFVDLLLDNRADVNMIDSQGCSPLHYACRQANPKILKKLIDRQADPHYVNPRETTNGTYQSNLSAFHYLAMVKGATVKNIKRCAMLLIECGCPLMPLTRQGQTPFDIAQVYNNHAFECVKIFHGIHQFNELPPIEVSSRNDAKTLLNDLACPNMIGKIRLRLKQYDNRDSLGCDGLFLLYKTRATRSEPNVELGLCVHHGGQIFTYLISQKYHKTITNLSNPQRTIVYTYSLMIENPKIYQAQVALFRSCEELIYNHTKYKGILPTTLKDFVRKGNGETITMNAGALLLHNTHRISMTDIEDGPETDDDVATEIDASSIDSFDLSQIYSATHLNENHRRLIWIAKVRLDQTTSFPIIIKDYLPNKDLESYKHYRSNELNNHSRHRNNVNQKEFSFEFSSRTRLEYKHESELLLKELKNHPLIVHAFICDHHLKKDLRIFMEYIPSGNLHSYLTRLKPDSVDPLMNAFHWIYQLAQVMAYLSSKKIVHRDLATRNILLKHEQYIKLSDFGLSRYEGLIPEGKDCILSPRWTAPECFDRNQKISSSSDVWSFGVVIWEIWSFGTAPYDAEINNDTQQLVRLLKRFLVEQGRRLSRPDSCSEGMYDLMYRCWNGNVDKRPRFVEIINDLNGLNTRKDRIVPFTHEERRAWKKANEQYLLINPPTRTLSNNDGEYVPVEDNENDDNESVITAL